MGPVGQHLPNHLLTQSCCEWFYAFVSWRFLVRCCGSRNPNVHFPWIDDSLIRGFSFSKCGNFGNSGIFINNFCGCGLIEWVRVSKENIFFLTPLRNHILPGIVSTVPEVCKKCTHVYRERFWWDFRFSIVRLLKWMVCGHHNFYRWTKPSQTTEPQFESTHITSWLLQLETNNAKSSSLDAGPLREEWDGTMPYKWSRTNVLRPNYASSSNRGLWDQVRLVAFPFVESV